MLNLVKAGGFFLLVASNAAMAQDRPEVSYLLPRTRLTAGVSQTLAQCPPSAQAQADGEKGDLKFTYLAAITAKAVPDRLVRIDARSGFLVDRSTAVKLTEDGLLKEFNGTAKGQGGPLLTSIIKAGAIGVSLTAGPLPAVAAAGAIGAAPALLPGIKGAPGSRPPAATRTVTVYYLQCKAETTKGLERIAGLRSTIAKLEANVLSGTASAATEQLLALRLADLAEAQAALTQSVTLTAPLSPMMNAAGEVSGLSGLIPEVDFSRWLEIVGVPRVIASSATYKEELEPPKLEVALSKSKRGVTPGQYGFQVIIKVDARSSRWFGCGSQAGQVACKANDVADTDVSGRDFVYRRPVQAIAVLTPLHAPCAAVPCPAAPDDWPAGGDVSAVEPVKLAQLSRLFYVPTGGGSIFGSRSVAAELGPLGEPLTLKYERGSASADVAGVLDASAAAAQTLDGARLAATNKRVDEIEAADKLTKLLKEELDAPE
jgi:hypothetical protein